MSIPLAIFSYIGIELVTVTAAEARTNSQLKLPAKNIAYIICAIYMISLGGIAASVEWFNPNLPQFLSQDLVNITINAELDIYQLIPLLGHIPHSWVVLPNLHNITAAPAVAAMEAGSSRLPGVLIAFIIYSGIVTANTALYVSSRTLYGLTRVLMQDNNNIFYRSFAKLNTVAPTTRIPYWALGASCLIFAGWLPFVHLRSNFNELEV
jgi:yeast amino acid transporter